MQLQLCTDRMCFIIPLYSLEMVLTFTKEHPMKEENTSNKLAFAHNQVLFADCEDQLKREQLQAE